MSAGELRLGWEMRIPARELQNRGGWPTVLNRSPPENLTSRRATSASRISRIRRWLFTIPVECRFPPYFQSHFQPSCATQKPFSPARVPSLHGSGEGRRIA